MVCALCQIIHLTTVYDGWVLTDQHHKSCVCALTTNGSLLYPRMLCTAFDSNAMSSDRDRLAQHTCSLGHWRVCTHAGLSTNQSNQRRSIPWHKWSNDKFNVHSKRHSRAILKCSFSFHQHKSNFILRVYRPYVLTFTHISILKTAEHIERSALCICFHSLLW